MNHIFELIMLICFGIAWPTGIVKMLRTKTSAGKSLIFPCIVIVGYIAGIINNILVEHGSYVLYFYILNMVMVSVDLGLCLRYREKAKTP